MKYLKLVIAFLLLVIFNINIKSQDGWFVCYTYSDILLKTYYLDTQYGWITGRPGYPTPIHRTTNGGLNWEVISNTGLNGDPLSMWFANANTGWVACGSVPSFFQTVNGGYNWTQFTITLPQFDWQDWRCVYISPSNNFLSVGVTLQGTIFRTTLATGSGGPNNISFLGPPIYGMNRMRNVKNSEQCWVACNSGIALLANNGFVSTINPAVNFSGISFPDWNTGYTVGGNYCYKTTNVGSNWSRIFPHPTASYYDVCFVNKDTGWVTCSSPSAILKTTNGGLNWVQQSTSSGSEIWFANDFTGWILSGNTILKTTTGGSAAPLPAPNLLLPPHGSIVYTLTPFFDWDDVPSATFYHLQIAADTLFNVLRHDTTGFAVSNLTVRSGVLIAGSTNYWRVRGENSSTNIGLWSSIRRFSVASLPNTPNLTSPPNGAIGQSLTPLLDWDSVAYSNSFKVQVSKNNLFTSIVLDSGGLLVSNLRVPAGRLTPDSLYYWRACGVNVMGQGPWSAIWNFRVSPLPPAPNLFAPPNGAQGQSLTPLLDWSAVTGAASYRVQVTTDSIFAVINTLDSSNVTGDSLRIPNGRLANNVKYFWRVNATNAGGTGPWSVVWNFRVGYIGLTQFGNEIPKEYKLYNNYPNPFNPVTKIKFDLPKQDFVSIVIFDILGREVATLVNEQLKPGTYETEFDGTNYPSGVYYYILTTETYTNTKRMVLLK